MTTTAAEAHKSGGMGKDLIVYACLLALAGLQFVIAHQNIDVSQMFVRMLAVACVEAGVGGFFFLHLLLEKRVFFVFFVIFFGFFLFGVQYWVGHSFPVGYRAAFF